MFITFYKKLISLRFVISISNAVPAPCWYNVSMLGMESIQCTRYTLYIESLFNTSLEQYAWYEAEPLVQWTFNMPCCLIFGNWMVNVYLTCIGLVVVTFLLSSIFIVNLCFTCNLCWYLNFVVCVMFWATISMNLNMRRMLKNQGHCSFLSSDVCIRIVNLDYQ